MPKRKPKTAEQLMKELHANPAWLKSHNERQDALEATRSALRAEQAPLLEDLKAVGWDVESVWDLVNTDRSYSSAVPILIDHLSRGYSERTLEGIARALAVPEASDYGPVLLKKYRMTSGPSGLKNGLAIAVAATCPEEVAAETVRDTSQDDSRLHLLTPLQRSRSELAKQTLSDLRNDPALAKEIELWMRKTMKRKRKSGTTDNI